MTTSGDNTRNLDAPLRQLNPLIMIDQRTLRQYQTPISSARACHYRVRCFNAVVLHHG
jgi:hypothetical protein